MKKLLIIFSFFNSLHAISQIYSGGIDIGGSYTNFNDKDTLSLNASFSPTIGFSLYKNLKPKWYFGVSAGFTQRNGVSISPSLKYKTLYLDWRADLKYKFSTKAYLIGGLVIQQKLNANLVKSQSKTSLDGIVNHQTNPFMGLAIDVNKYTANFRFYIPRVLYNKSPFNIVNQYKYAEVSVTFPIKSKLDEEEKTKIESDKLKSEADIKALKSGILLVALPQSNTVKDKELGTLLAKAFEKNYNFSKYFIVDETDIDSLIKTGKISVYESYPFLAKQQLDLTNLSWYYIDAGKTSIIDEKNKETYEIKGVSIYDKDKQQLKDPFPFYMPISGNNVDASIKSLNAELDKYYYQIVFKM